MSDRCVLCGGDASHDIRSPHLRATELDPGDGAMLGTSPGPWARKCEGTSVDITDAGGRAIACVYADAGERDERLFNAALISAAPDLLALARRVAEHFAGTDAPLGLEARSLIAKAEGGEG